MVKDLGDRGYRVVKNAIEWHCGRDWLYDVFRTSSYIVKGSVYLI